MCIESSIVMHRTANYMRQIEMLTYAIMLNVISFVLNVEMSTGFVLVTVKTSYAHTYLQNLKYALLRVLEVLYT